MYNLLLKEKLGRNIYNLYIKLCKQLDSNL